jgi:hypothetical protein
MTSQAKIAYKSIYLSAMHYSLAITSINQRWTLMLSRRKPQGASYILWDIIDICHGRGSVLFHKIPRF